MTMLLVKGAIRSLNSADVNHQVVLPRILFNIIVPFGCTKSVAATRADYFCRPLLRLMSFLAFGGPSFLEFIKSRD